MCFGRKVNTMSKILIIDHDIEVCRQLKCSIQSDTIFVYYVISIHDALLFLRKNECCLIILETQLADVGGMELLASIRGLHTMPIPVLSQYGILKNEQLASHRGADVFPDNPFITEECLIRAQELVRYYANLKSALKRSYTIVI